MILGLDISTSCTGVTILDYAGTVVLNTCWKFKEDDTFDKILKWLSNRGDAFRTGERNVFLYKLASACCRFGISELDCVYFFNKSFILSPLNPCWPPLKN